MIPIEWINIEKDKYIFRVVHRIMEGDCQCEHGPIPVEIRNIEAMKYAVTNAQYYEFIKESGYRPRDMANYLKHWENGKYREGEEDLPVVNVSIYDAKAYAEFYGWRLPSDPEWQYLAGGPDKLLWPWGNKKDYAHCNVFGSALEPVNSHEDGVSPFGCYNMCGNCWEMVGDVITDTAHATYGHHRFILLRGGSYYTPSHYWHAESGAIRNDYHLKMHLLGGAMDRNETVGFRCVRDL